jgi:hypothetical protein
LNRNDLSPTRRRTRNVIASPIPRDLVETTVRTIDHVPGWLDPTVFIIHMLAGISLLGNAMMYGLENRFAILIIFSAFLFVTVAINAHFPAKMKRWFFAFTDILALLGLRIACDFVIVSDPNVTMIILLSVVCVIFAAYLDPQFSKVLSIVGVFGTIVILTPYMLPQIFENLFRANLTHSQPTESLLLLAAFSLIVTSTLLMVTSHRKWKLGNATRFLERVQVALVSRRS